MIRERDNPRYRKTSIGYHLLATAGMLWVSLPLTAVFALLLARAWLLPGRGLAPVRIGLLEVATSLLVLLAILVN